MAAMDDMLGKMLQKVIPPEVMAMLTPEKINAVGEGIKNAIIEIKESQAAIITEQERIAATLVLILERMDNAGSDGNAKRRTAGRIAPAGNGGSIGTTGGS